MSAGKSWAESFQNFEKMYLVFQDIASLSQNLGEPTDGFSELEIAGVIRYFQALSDLSWEVTSEYLQSEGLSVKPNPQDTIRQAFQNHLISESDAHKWMGVVEKRVESSRAFDSEVLDEIAVFAIVDFFPLAQDLYDQLKKEL